MDSKAERHEIYKGALESFNPFFGGLCWAINKCRTTKGILWPPIRLYDLPEIWEQRPKRMEDYPYWFNLDAEGAEKRKQILLNGIEATKP